jgi:hypothetical protein
MNKPNWKYLKVYKYYPIDPASGWQDREPEIGHTFFPSLDELAKCYGKKEDEEYYQISVSGPMNDIDDIVKIIKLRWEQERREKERLSDEAEYERLKQKLGK